MRTIILGLALLALPTAAAAADQFDLICEGRQQLRPSATWKPLAFRLRVDTRAMVWCSDACERLLPIAFLDAGTITLTRSDPAIPAAFALRTVDRISGQYRSYWSGESEEAMCVAAPFSGHPATKF